VPAKEDYYVTAAFHAPYKRLDVVIDAFTRMPSRRLVVVGDEAQSKHLRSRAGPNISFTGHLPRKDYVSHIAHARAMVFAGCEDFGITLAEAQFCGTPLIAFGRGGAADIVRPLGQAREPTGVLFPRQDAQSLTEAIGHFEANEATVMPLACHFNAERFSEARFDREILQAMASLPAMQG
jgi:glycosyltransferase involved in cell wall biosynthesis